MQSQLCLYDMATGTNSVLLQTERHIEAPNWHPDGYLIVNADGLIYRVPLKNPHLIQIDTGFATGCNNDHGISPDGKVLAISDKVETGQSCIYTLPITGGTPQRVTALTPSWWHGWSPDGKRLAYVGARGDRTICLYTCALDGSEETRITNGFDHVDGPDYSPDGAWIWFNGEKDGAVDLWRVRPDGADLERMTHDKAVNWFPHPSPDGRHIVYLAYPESTKGHPAGLHVTLRMMPAQGGASREIIALLGGQGTLNVPCWAPDSHAFAYVRYVP